jgi:hypothetical protein
MHLTNILAEIDLEISRLEQARTLLAGESSPAVKKIRKSKPPMPRLNARRSATCRRKAVKGSPKLSAGAGSYRKKQQESKPYLKENQCNKEGWQALALESQNKPGGYLSQPGKASPGSTIATISGSKISWASC